MNGTVHGPAAAARPRGAVAGHLMTGVVLPVVTAAVALAGLRVPGGVSPLDEVAVGVVLIWALAGAVCARAPGRAPLWPLAGGTLAAAVALTAARLASQPPAGQHQLARAVATLAAALVIAASCHFLLALPDGRLGGQARRTGAVIAYLGALGTGLVFALAGRPLPPLVAMLGLAVAVGCALPAVRVRYLHASAAGLVTGRALAICRAAYQFRHLLQCPPPSGHRHSRPRPAARQTACLGWRSRTRCCIVP